MKRLVGTALLISLAACGGGAGGGIPSAAGGAAMMQSGSGTGIADKASVRSTRARIAAALARTGTGNKHALAESASPSNVTTADPPVPRPQEAPCTVQLFTNFQFTSFTYPTFQYTPPANCPGPWAKVVLDANFAVTAGVQFDRTGSIWVAGTNIYFGTTAEPGSTYSPSWHVQRDVTDLTPIFETPSTGEVVLGNIVNSTYTGVISASATLDFYPASDRYRVADAPDAVYPLSGGPLGDNQYITTPSQPLTATYTLPTNVRAAYLDVYLQSQIDDEFWYTCFPNDLASEIPNCANTAFREGDVAIDGQAAGVVPVYPWIFTGGIDPYLWLPIPGVETLNFSPYRVDLTPFAALLSNGQPHTINVTVYNNGNYFAANAALLVYLDHGSSQVTGGIIENATQLEPVPSVAENVKVNAGVGTGTISVRSTHMVDIDGYVNTSRGRVETHVRQQISFSNAQQIYANTAGTLFDQNIKQDTNVLSETTTISHDGYIVASEQRDWPLLLVYDFMVNSDGSATQVASVSQGKNEQSKGLFGESFLSNNVQASDTLQFPATGGFTPTNPQTTQTYVANSRDFCWNKTVSAKNGLVRQQMGGPC
ncbi:MAG: peptide-N4-asparagine amidase [Candidatus Aquilonibacter sp.]